MPPPRSAGWTTWPEVRNSLRRRWDRGGYLSAHATGLPFEPVDLPIRGPGARDIGARFDEVRAWVAGWSATPGRVSVVDAPVGGRLIGVNRLPSRVRIESWDDLCAVLGVRHDVDTFDRLYACTTTQAPRLAEWMAAHPLRVLADADSWPLLVTTVRWIEHEARPGSYLREIDVPGVDTKFVERHRGVLTDLLERQLPPERIDPARSRSDFAGRHGFRNRPDYVRLRLPAGAPGPFTELAVRVEELARAPVDADAVLVVENEITYLALPPSPAVRAAGTPRAPSPRCAGSPSGTSSTGVTSTPTVTRSSTGFAASSPPSARCSWTGRRCSSTRPSG